MDEAKVRQKAHQWLRERYEKFSFKIPLMIFHGRGMTLSEYVRRYVLDLVAVPRYDSLHIEPDLAGLMNLSRIVSVWIIGECKYGNLSYGDLSQGITYSGIARAYEGFFFYTGRPTAVARANIDKGNDMFQGVNKLGKPVKKRIRRYRLNVHGSFKLEH